MATPTQQVKKKGNVTENVYDPTQIQSYTEQVIFSNRDNAKLALYTGIDFIDKDFVPLQATDIMAICGYTSNGKSMLANTIARYHAEHLLPGSERNPHGNKVVLTAIWEQSIEEQGISDISSYTHIPSNLIASGKLSDSEMGRIVEASTQRGRLPWWLIGHSSLERRERPRLSMTEIKAVLEWILYKVKMDPVLLVLDYLQRIKRKNMAEMREGFIDIVDDIKDLSASFGIPIIVPTQAKREVHRRDMACPQLDDSQETSNMEQTSDRFLSIWKVGQNKELGDHVVMGKRAWEVTDDLAIIQLLKNKKGKAPVTWAAKIDWATGLIQGQYTHIDKDDIKDAKKEAKKNIWTK